MNLLLLHGFTSHPLLTLGPLPQVLREAGFAVSQPALPGHGTRPENLLKVRWQDWLLAAREAYAALPEPRGVVGLSMGALLAAHLAAERPTRDGTGNSARLPERIPSCVTTPPLGRPGGVF
jgi:carboxylesterase